MREVYLNRAQQEYVLVAANTAIVIAARRFGKSFGIIASTVIRNVHAMPRSTGAFVSTTFKQANMRTLPALISGLGQFGFKRDIHFVIGKKPPKRLGFQRPHVEPVKYDDVMTWYNGTIMVIISQDIPMSSNSMTLDWVVGDEAKGLDFEKLKDETFPANGGTRRYFSDCTWHHSYLFVSDMPVLKSGNWLLNYREKMHEEDIDTIMGMMLKYREVSELPDSDYKNKKLSELARLIAQLRKVAVYYREWSTFENVDIVGLEYIKQMKRDLPPLVFQTSILSKRIGKLKSGFYPNFNEKIHCYVANNNSLIKDKRYSFTTEETGCAYDKDVNLNEPICISFDYNANINWLIAGQPNGSKLNILKSFYVKYERKLRELVDDFCNYYHLHLTHQVVFYYDSTAIGQNYAVNKDDFAAVICEQFAKNGWMVIKKYLGNPLKHNLKYNIINDCFMGAKHFIPFFNVENNYALLLSIKTAEVYIGAKGFQKYKGGEKLAETEVDLLEYRTDGSDAFDTLVLGCIQLPYSGHTSGFGSSAR